MRFSEVAQELKPYLNPHATNAEFVVALVGDMLRVPMDEDEQRLDEDGEFNPLASLSLNMQNQIYKGSRPISKKNAGLICNRYDGRDFIEMVDDLYEADKENLQKFLADNGLNVAIADLSAAFDDIFRQIFLGLTRHEDGVDIRLTIYDGKPSIKNLASDRVYCDDGKLYIDGDVIELPVRLSDADVYDFEAAYIAALCDAYAEALSRDDVTIEDIPELPPKYQKNFYDQRKSYLSAESIQRSIREVYDDGRNQFDILKEDAYGGLRTTYLDDYDNGYRRLLEVLKKASDIQLTKSKLSLIKNLIGNLERLGIVHILVNDGVMKSWVDPYGG